MATDDDATFLGMDEAYLRLVMANGGVTPERRVEALNWLAQRDREDRSRREASQASQERIARDAAMDARNASKDARAAMIITAVGAVIALLSWLFPRH